MELNELPKRILFIGGGYIAFEFAHVAVRAGAQVTIAHRGPRPLPRFDPELVDQLVKSTRELGVDVQLGTEVIRVEKSSGQLVEGILVAANLLKGNSEKPNYLGIPTVVFAIPPLAAVGLSESEAHSKL